MSQLHKSIQLIGLDEIVDKMDLVDPRPLTYPIADREEAFRRIMVLRRLGVTALYLQVGYEYLTPVVVGKGFRGVVIKCTAGPEDAVVKMTRLDSPKTDLTDEARHQAMACKLGLAPKILGWNREMILMEYADGVPLGDKMKLRADEVGMVLEACFRLDRAGIDHGQLSDASHHIILRSKGPLFIDFGHASTMRRPRNLTSLTSYLLNRLHINPKEHKELLDLLQRYSQTRKTEIYQGISEYILRHLPLG